jgi:hypothetical protein
MLNPDMQIALQALLDKQAITELVNTYCRAADRHDHALMRSLYHEDATDDHGSFFKGLAMEFIDMLPEIQKPMQILHHNVTTLNIRLDPDDANRAEGEVYILAFHQVAGADGAFDLLIGGRYFDSYAKRDGVWKFSSRAVVADWANLHSPSIVNLDNPVIAGAYIGKPGLADPSYGVFRLLPRGG